MKAVDGDTSNDGGREDLVSEGLLTVREAAEFLKLSRSRLYELMNAGELAYVKIGGSRRVPRRVQTSTRSTPSGVTRFHHGLV